MRITKCNQVSFFDYFFEMTKDNFFPILMQLLMVPLSWADQKLKWQKFYFLAFQKNNH